MKSNKNKSEPKFAFFVFYDILPAVLRLLCLQGSERTAEMFARYCCAYRKSHRAQVVARKGVRERCAFVEDAGVYPFVVV